MADELASVEASPQHPSLTAARESAADLRHRISLHTVTLAPRPLVLPGLAPLPSAGHPVNALPELWHRHRRDPVRRPSHQDAVGHPGPDGAPLDGEGGRLTDGFRTHWVDVPLAAAADPATPLSEIDALTDHSVAVLRRYGAGAAEIAGLRARVLLATGRLEQARELMELVGEAPCGVEELAVVGGTVALLRGDLDTLLRVLCHGEDTGLAAGTWSSVQWTLHTAASLVPLAHMVDTTTTVDRMRFLTADDGDPVVLDVAAEFVRRSDCAAGHGVGCFACARPIAPSARGLLTEVDRMVRECACAGTAHDAPDRVRTMTRLWSDAHPLVRRLIDFDILLSGALPTRPSAEYAVQGLWTALRLLPRAVPLTGGALVEAESGRGIVDATVITAVTASARSLPAPPSASPLGLVDHVADLADLADALVTAGACHEACTVAAAGLAAVGGNWVDTGVASGCAPGEAGADDDGPVRLLRARSAALSSLGNTAGADRCAEAAATAAEYRGRWRLAEACRVDAAARRA